MFLIESQFFFSQSHCFRTLQIFDFSGNYKRQFGSKGAEADAHFHGPAGLATDGHGNMLVLDSRTDRLQLFDIQGTHLCTRSDLGLRKGGYPGVSWNTATGALAITNGTSNEVRVWGREWARKTT